jgi:dipeptidyl aminopeptidase/acylaminoacyl peptidase
LLAVLTHPKPYRYASNAVDAVVFSFDGKTFITSSNRRIYLWDVATAKLRGTLIDPDVRLITEIYRSLKGFSHGDTIYDVAISPDGHTLATVSRDHTAKLWDLDSGKLKATLPHGGKVWFVVFSPDNKTLATGSDDRTARLWNASSGKLIATLPHRGTVHSLSFSADSAVISTASDNEKWVNIWRVATGELLVELPEARPPVVFSPIGRTLATASRGSDVLLWDIPFK